LIERLESISDTRSLEEAMAFAEQKVNDMGMMERIVELRFETQSDRAYGGSPWAPLASSTVRARGGGGMMLVDTGLLRDSAISAVAGTYSIRNPVTWNASGVTEYSEYIQNGTPRMPARPFLLDPDEDELSDADEVAVDEIAGYLMRAQ